MAKEQKFKIKDIPKVERPRGKLISNYRRIIEYW